MVTEWRMVIWLGISVALACGMRGFPLASWPRTGWQRPWVWCFLSGEFGVAGSVRIGLGLAVAGWWCDTAGLLTAASLHDAYVMTAGLMAIVGLFNAGRRAALSTPVLAGLGATLGAGAIGLMWFATG